MIEQFAQARAETESETKARVFEETLTWLLARFTEKVRDPCDIEKNVVIWRNIVEHVLTNGGR